MKLIKNYHKDEQLRKTMSHLAVNTFGVDFDLFYKSGFWTDKYKNISFEENGEIISNVSCYELTIEKEHRIYKGVQFGAVMTHKDYRQKGLSRKLMKEAINDYKNKDVIYLSANENVTEFYPKFGFEPVKYIKFKQTDFSGLKGIRGKKLDYDQDMALIKEIVFSRNKNSQSDYVYEDSELKMFYLMFVYRDCIYLHDQSIVIIEKENDSLFVHDFYTPDEMDISEILGGYLEGVQTIFYGFHPKLTNIIPYEDKEAYLFVLTKEKELLKPWFYPATSIT